MVQPCDEVEENSISNIPNTDMYFTEDEDENSIEDMISIDKQLWREFRTVLHKG